jgi:hypothetical protein
MDHNPEITMKMHSQFIGTVILRLLCSIAFLFSSAGAFADPELFELRTLAGWYGQTIMQSPDGGVTQWNIGSLGFDWNWNGSSWDGYASLTNVTIDPNDGTAVWTFIDQNGQVATTDAAAIANAQNAGNVLWLNFQPTNPGNQTMNFLIDATYAWDSLGIVQLDNAGGVSIISPVSTYYYSYEEGDFFGYTAWAPYDPSKPFWVADFTTGVRWPIGASLLLGDAATPDATVYALHSVTFYLNATSDGDHFTLHWQKAGQAEMLQSLTATQDYGGLQTLGDGSNEDETGTVSITGSVASGATYWVTRDADGWSSSAWYLDPDPLSQNPNPLQWSLRDYNPPSPLWVTVTFNIAAGYGWDASVNQPSGTRSLTPIYNGVQTLADYDIWGNPHYFYYEQWTAEIRNTEPFWLTVNATQGSQGDTWFYNGWTAIGGVQPNYQSVGFNIASGFGNGSYVYQTVLGSVYLTLVAQGLTINDYVNGGPSDGAPNLFIYDQYTATIDTTRPFFLTVNGITLDANQTWYYNGWQLQGGITPNWQTMYFTIASGIGYGGSVVQTDGVQPFSWCGSGYIQDYMNDNSGTPNFFYYDVFSALVDINRPFSLNISDFYLLQNQTAFYNGWQCQGGPSTPMFTLNLTLNADRVNDGFTLKAPDGTETSLNSWSNGSDAVTLANSWVPESWIYYYTVYVTSQQISWNPTPGAWVLTDNTTGESESFDPSGAASYAWDLSQWWVPATPMQMEVSLSRWGHDLRVRQRDGGEYSLNQLSSQGSVTFTQDGSWYQSYYYFDAVGYARMMTGVDWWVYDATTGEYAAPNTSDLTYWYFTPNPGSVSAGLNNIGAATITWNMSPGGSELLAGGFVIQRAGADGNWVQIDVDSAQNLLDPQGSGLMFAYTDAGVNVGSFSYRICYYYGSQSSAFVQSNAVSVLVSTYGNGLPDYWVNQYNLNLSDPNLATEIALSGLTYLQEYRLGLNPTVASTTNDGIPDGWAVQYGLNPLDPNLATENAPGGITYLQKYQLGLNPLVADTDGDGFDDGTEIANGTDPLRPGPTVTLTAPTWATLTN